MHGTIVCGVAASADARATAQPAAALAERLGLRLVLVHVVERPGTGWEGALQVDALARELGEEVEVRVVHGSRVDELARVAADEGADAIVLGARPRGRRGNRLGCTLARQLEAGQSVPVLIAPPATRARSGRRLGLAEATVSR